jgi:hypothetical protein
MGFFDVGPYDNDFALDWLADNSESAGLVT